MKILKPTSNTVLPDSIHDNPKTTYAPISLFLYPLKCNISPFHWYLSAIKFVRYETSIQTCQPW